MGKRGEATGKKREEEGQKTVGGVDQNVGGGKGLDYVSAGTMQKKATKGRCFPYARPNHENLDFGDRKGTKQLGGKERLLKKSSRGGMKVEGRSSKKETPPVHKRKGKKISGLYHRSPEPSNQTSGVPKNAASLGRGRSLGRRRRGGPGKPKVVEGQKIRQKSGKRSSIKKSGQLMGHEIS